MGFKSPMVLIVTKLQQQKKITLICINKSKLHCDFNTARSAHLISAALATEQNNSAHMCPHTGIPVTLPWAFFLPRGSPRLP